MKKITILCCLSLLLASCGGEDLAVEDATVGTVSLSSQSLSTKNTVPIPSANQDKTAATTPLSSIPNETMGQSSQLTVVAQDLLGKPLQNIDIQLDQSRSQKTNQQGLVTFDAVPLGKHDIHFLSPQHEWVSLYQTNNKNIIWKLPAKEDSYVQFQGRLSNFDQSQQGHRLDLVFLHPQEKRVMGRSSCYTAEPMFRCFGVLNGISADTYAELDIIAIERDQQQRVISSQQIAYRFLYYTQNIDQLSIAYSHQIQFPKQLPIQKHLLSIQGVTAITGSNPSLIEASAFAPGGYGTILNMQSTWPSDLYAAIQPTKLWAIAIASTADGGFWSIIKKVPVASIITDMYATLSSPINLNTQTLLNTEQSTINLQQAFEQRSIQQLIIRDQNNTRALWRLYFSPQQQQLTLPKIVRNTLPHRLQAQGQYQMQQQLWLMDQLDYDQALIHMGNIYGLSLHQHIEIISTGAKPLIFK
ncbi:MAG: hypothetical protein Q9M28_03605 [Mariprofundaceae bacterium]|nr:hypothetical protein [Mariprofundaceae bacterium]